MLQRINHSSDLCNLTGTSIVQSNQLILRSYWCCSHSAL